MTAREAQARAADGTTLTYKVWGDKDARNRFVLVHSLAMTSDFWAEVADALPKDCAVLAPDCRGHGASGKPAGPYRVEGFAEDLAVVMDAAGWDKACIAGASMGGCVALAFAEAYPHRVTGLGLIDTTACYGPEAPEAWEGRAIKAIEGSMAALVGFQKTRWFSDAFREANPEAVEAAIAVFVKNDVKAYAESCRMLGHCDQRAALAAFTFPTEIVVGEEDYATPVAMAEAMQAAIPGARLTILEGVRHLTPLEVPDKIASLLVRLVDSH